MAAIYPKLENALALDGYKLLLMYSNGEKRLYDFKPNLTHSFYSELSNPALFRKAAVSNGDLEWPTGQDFCPHTLYEKSLVYNDPQA